MGCQHCKAENEGGWFYCRECGKRAHAPRYSTATIIRDGRFATAIRKDLINFKTMSMAEDIESKGGEISGNI